jgi:hypothetical protein
MIHDVEDASADDSGDQRHHREIAHQTVRFRRQAAGSFLALDFLSRQRACHDDGREHDKTERRQR